MKEQSETWEATIVIPKRVFEKYTPLLNCPGLDYKKEDIPKFATQCEDISSATVAPHAKSLFRADF